MKLSSVLEKIAHGTTVTIFDSLTDYCYANTEVGTILNNRVYRMAYKNCMVDSIDAQGDEIVIKIVND